VPIDRTLARVLFGAAPGFAMGRHMTTKRSEYTQERAALVQPLATRCQPALSHT